MGTAPGAIRLVKAGFVVLDVTGAIQKIVAFQYNPETLVRKLEGAVAGAAGAAAPSSGTAAAGGISAGAGAPGAKTSGRTAAGVSAAAGTAGAGAVAAPARGAAAPVAAATTPSPHEVVSFTISLDAADKLQVGDALTQQSGVYPALSALELLMYPQPNTLTVWVSGGKRILPVSLTQMQIVEQMFDPALNPIRAEVSIALQVLKDADLANNAHGKALWDAHYNLMQQLANALSGVSLATLGITAI